MLQEVLEALRLSEGSTVCDCTLGGAGHSVKMAVQVGEEGLLIGIDQDDMALAAARTRLASEAPGVPLKLLKGNFGDLDELLCRAEVPGIDGILFDLGVSSPQLDIPGRGFSYHEDAPLDMRMDPGNNPLNAAEVINTYNEADLARILRVYGEEKFADKIAREIVRRRQLSPIETTGELVEAIKPLVADAGCEVVRMAIPRRDCLDAFQAVCEASPLPVVADIHFDAHIAIEAARRGAAKLRINPGNIGGWSKTDAVLDAAGEVGIPIRIGVNAGSLDESIAALYEPLPRKLALSAEQYVRHCEDRGFSNLVVSAKAHDVMATVATYRLLARELPQVPLHIGITEAGTVFQGIIKSACGLGILLEEGIGDTLRISLTDDPVQEIRACWTLLAALDLRRRAPELISCPTCGRCQVNLIGLAKQVEERIATLQKPLKVAPARRPMPTSAWRAAMAWASFFPKARPSAKSMKQTSWTL